MCFSRLKETLCLICLRRSCSLCIRYMAMSTSKCMGFKRRLLHAIFVVYLLLVTLSLFTVQQDTPNCGPVMCGLNGICRGSGNCTCLPGFHFVVSDNPSKGCRQNTFPLGQSCTASGAEMHTIERVDFKWNDYMKLNFTDAAGCKKACLEDCLCVVAVYDQNCWMKSLPMRNGAENNLTTAFVKIYNRGYDAAAPPPPPSKQAGREEIKGKGFAAVGISLMGCSLVFAAVLLIIWLYSCKRKVKTLREDSKASNPVGLKAFSYGEVEAASGGFKEEIGRGAFGKVYKGVLSDGREIAVKKLEDDLLKQQHDGEKEFRTEMGILGACHHKNLIQLYGFCAQGSHRFLIYKYMSIGSLDNVLFKGTRDLDWELRVQIVSGIARGLLYLREECETPTIHCDIKPQNILLDENYRAKIADFGISKLIGAEQTRTFTVARRTIGYIAPEWHKNVAVTVKVDVYSFGVVLLEIVCCRKMFELHLPQDEMVLCDWVYDCFKYGQLSKLVERQDCRGFDSTQLERMVLVGLWCIQEDSSLRPAMKKVVQMLEGTIEILVPPLPEVSPHKCHTCSLEAFQQLLIGASSNEEPFHREAE